jgi:hypothetical protein
MNTRFKKLTGMHKGHVYKVVAPANESESPLRWSMQCEGEADDKITVPENQLEDRKLWQAMD